VESKKGEPNQKERQDGPQRCRDMVEKQGTFFAPIKERNSGKDNLALDAHGCGESHGRINSMKPLKRRTRMALRADAYSSYKGQKNSARNGGGGRVGCASNKQERVEMGFNY